MDTTTLEDLDESHANEGYDLVQLLVDQAHGQNDVATTAPIWMKPGATGLTDRHDEDDSTMKILRVTSGTRDGVETRLRALDFDVDGFVKPD